MKNIALAALVAAALSPAAVGFAATASAAPTGPSDAQSTIDTLRSSGYRVTMERNGSGPLSACTVDSVRRGSSPITPGRTSDDRADVDRLGAATVVVELTC